MADGIIKLRKFTCDPTINIRIVVTREFKVRLALGLWLIKIGCRITGMGLNVEKGE